MRRTLSGGEKEGGERGGGGEGRERKGHFFLCSSTIAIVTNCVSSKISKIGAR